MQILIYLRRRLFFLWTLFHSRFQLMQTIPHCTSPVRAEKKNLKKKIIILDEESPRCLTCRSSASSPYFFQAAYHIFSSNPFSACLPLTSFSLPKFKHADACKASAPTKCSFMLCYFPPAKAFICLCTHISFTPSPLLRKPKQGLLLCCFLLLLLLFISGSLCQLLTLCFLFALHSTKDNTTAYVNEIPHQG